MVSTYECFGCDNSIGNDSVNPVVNSMGRPTPGVDRAATPDSIIPTTPNDFTNRARLPSSRPPPYGTSCCFTEFAPLIGSRSDSDRHGSVPRSSPRQADLIITAGTATTKMAPSLVRSYEQTPEPKHAIAMGACTVTGGMLSTDPHSTVRGVDKSIPADTYPPGRPPKPEAIVDATIKPREKVSRETYDNYRDKLREGNRFLTPNHQFRIVSNMRP
uniref:NADH-plastoquinone oxidoreductase subunit K n=1 Tax=Selaginella uncinata TaxID=307165 RepID=A0A482A273_SELUN|nr:NADH-plastoquinone oxidoreductase subunit K [Selaginella uncinata]QBL07873.1 NADH-plastoquinone oxidoreductase subunit K [Selaginella uncinata]